MNVNNNFFLGCFARISAFLTLVSLFTAPLVHAKTEADAPRDTTMVRSRGIKGGAEADSVRMQRRDAMLDTLMSEMKERLKLNEKQGVQIRSILAESLEKQRTLREKAREQGRRDMRSAMKDMQKQREETDKHIEGVLTKEQVKEYRKLREEQREKMLERMRQRRGRGR